MVNQKDSQVKLKIRPLLSFVAASWHKKFDVFRATAGLDLTNIRTVNSEEKEPFTDLFPK